MSLLCGHLSWPKPFKSFHSWNMSYGVTPKSLGKKKIIIVFISHLQIILGYFLRRLRSTSPWTQQQQALDQVHMRDIEQKVLHSTFFRVVLILSWFRFSVLSSKPEWGMFISYILLGFLSSRLYHNFQSLKLVGIFFGSIFHGFVRMVSLFLLLKWSGEIRCYSPSLIFYFVFKYKYFFSVRKAHSCMFMAEKKVFQKILGMVLCICDCACLASSHVTIRIPGRTLCHVHLWMWNTTAFFLFQFFEQRKFK